MDGEQCAPRPHVRENMRMRLVTAGAKDWDRGKGEVKETRRSRGDRVSYEDSWNTKPTRLGSALKAIGSHSRLLRRELA